MIIRLFNLYIYKDEEDKDLDSTNACGKAQQKKRDQEFEKIGCINTY